MRNKGIPLLIGAGFLYGFWGIISRSLHNQLPLFFQFWTRNVVIILIFFILIVTTKSWKRIERKDIKWFAAKLIAGTIGSYPLYYVFNYLPIGTVYFASYSALAISGFFLAFFFFKEKIKTSELIALFFAIAGLLLIYTFNFNLNKIFYLCLALASGVGYAVWGTFSKKISSNYSWIQLGFIEYLTFFAVSFLMSIILKEGWSLPYFSSVWLINFSFILVSVIPFILIFYGFKSVTAHLGNLVLLSEILFGIIFAFLLYRETISLPNLIGGSLIIASIALPDLILLSKK